MRSCVEVREPIKLSFGVVNGVGFGICGVQVFKGKFLGRNGVA